MENIADALAYEIKREVANRYFGFRKQIESDTNIYLEKLHNYNRGHCDKIRLDLQRLQFLFPDKELFIAISELAELPPDFTVRLLSNSPTPSSTDLFYNLKGHGFTKKGRFQNLCGKVYELLALHINEYRETFIELAEEHQEICRQIASFYRTNDLSGILTFFRELDNSANWRTSVLQTDTPVGGSQQIDRDLRLPYPAPVTDTMTPLSSPKSLHNLKKQLSSICRIAIDRHGTTLLEKLPG